MKFSVYFILISSLLLTNKILAAEPLSKIFEGKTDIKNPFKIRDPFQRPRFKSAANKSQINRSSGVLDTTEYYDQPFDINKIQVSGVLIGNKRRAMIKVSGDVGEKVYTYREGDVRGDKGPEIKAILPGGIILVEQIDNAYGQSEYIETVIPISQ